MKILKILSLTFFTLLYTIGPIIIPIIGLYCTAKNILFLLTIFSVMYSIIYISSCLYRGEVIRIIVIYLLEVFWLTIQADSVNPFFASLISYPLLDTIYALLGLAFGKKKADTSIQETNFNLNEK